MLKEIEVYSDETKEDISIYAYIKGSRTEIEAFRDKCNSVAQGAGLAKGSALSSNALTVAEELLSLLESSSLNVVLVLSDTEILSEATKTWIKRSRKCLERIENSANLNATQKTVVSQRFTQLLPFFAASDPNDQSIVSLYPDNTGQWINHQNSIVTITSEEFGVSCDVDLKTFIGMSARANAYDFTRIFGKKIPEIKLLEAQTDAVEIIICVADYLANFTLNYFRQAVGCTLSDKQNEKARIIGGLFPKLGCPELIKFLNKLDGKLDFDISSGLDRYVTQLK